MMFAQADVAEHTRMLTESVARFCAGHGGLAWSRRGRTLDRPARRALWRQVAEQGWLGVRVAEADGGLGLALADLAALHAQWGHAVGPAPLAPLCVLGVGAVAGSQASALRDRLLPGLLDGSVIAALAWQSAAGAMDASDVQIQARHTVDGAHALSGVARFVAGAGLADGVVVAAQAPSGLGLFWVPVASPGLALAPQASVDYGDMCSLRLDDVAVTQAQCLAAGAHAVQLLHTLLHEARIAVAAELQGLSEAVFGRTLDYLRERRQFGRAIGANQALQHRAVDLYIQIQLGRGALQRAVRVAAQGGPEVLAAQALACKSRCSDVALTVTRQAIQLHGGIGYTEECDISLFVRRAQALAPWLGNARDCRTRGYVLAHAELAA